MIVHFSYKNCQATADVEKMIARHMAKFERLLKVYNPDMIHVKGSLTQREAKGGQDFEASVNLRLPTGQMQGREASSDALAALRVAFDELERQLKQHKELVRHEQEWKKKR
jgi:ribosomal subunit interface protein